MQLYDQLQRKVILTQIPKRIISLVPSQTELLCDLGLEDAIVGVTKFCVHPKHIKTSKEVVGGTKTIKIEKLKALNPDIILCNKEENTQEIVSICETLCPVHVSDIFTIEDCIELIIQYGAIFNKKEEANNIVNSIQEKILSFKQFVKNKPVLKVAYFIWRNPWMVAANNTFIQHLLQLNSFENVFVSKERYPEINLNTLPNHLDLILLSSEPYPFKDEHASEIIEYSPNAKVIFVDGEMFSWYGSRLIKAFDYFKTLRNELKK